MREFPKRAAVIFTVLLLLSTRVANGVEVEPPESLGGLRLVHVLRGEEALQAIDHLHGKELGGQGGYVAHYETSGAVAMLYVSKASSVEQAARQVQRMTERIGQGTTPFYHLKSSEREGTTVYSALGQGQIHYFFQEGLTVIWLAADAPVANESLRNFFRRAQ